MCAFHRLRPPPPAHHWVAVHNTPAISLASQSHTTSFHESVKEKNQTRPRKSEACRASSLFLSRFQVRLAHSKTATSSCLCDWTTSICGERPRVGNRSRTERGASSTPNFFLMRCATILDVHRSAGDQFGISIIVSACFLREFDSNAKRWFFVPT